MQESARTIPTPLLVGEILSPHQDSLERRSSALTSLWCLVATIIGGGVLALPFAFQKCGIIIGSLSMILAALLNSFSLDVLVSAARRSGSATYEEVARKCMGYKAQIATILILVGMLWMVIVSYIIISADLITPVVSILVPPDWRQSPHLRIFAKLATIAAMGPLCYAKTLNALKPMSFVSVVSVLFLTVSILLRSITSIDSPHDVVTWTPQGAIKTVIVDPLNSPIRLWPVSFADYIYVFPTFIMALLCQYNVLPTHSELEFPTRQRMRNVSYITIGSCTFIYLLIGIFGYLFARDDVCANIMLNFSASDIIVTIGRLGLSLSVMGSIPLAMLPCRQALCRLIDVRRNNRTLVGGSQTLQQHSMENLAAVPSSGCEHDLGDTSLANPPLLTSEDNDQQAHPNTVRGLIVTTGLLASTTATALKQDNIMVLWSITGASFSLVIAFLLPSLFFLRVRATKPFGWRKALAYGCAIGTVIVGTTGTYISYLHSGDPTCPQVVV